MTKVAEAVSLGNMDADFEKHSNDEIGGLADAFTRMKASLQIAIKRLAKKSDRIPDQSN
jgi:methyl-accepting chemotaxis protein